jgi:hypothetical protein
MIFILILEIIIILQASPPNFGVAVIDTGMTRRSIDDCPEMSKVNRLIIKRYLSCRFMDMIERNVICQ